MGSFNKQKMEEVYPWKFGVSRSSPKKAKKESFGAHRSLSLEETYANIVFDELETDSPRSIFGETRPPLHRVVYVLYE
ncbi:hypothetical protein ACLB2K_053165 [Fragaria x ananassa]